MKALMRISKSMLLLATATCCFETVRAGVPSELFNYIPPAPNAVAVVDAAQLFDSPLAKRESWATTFADAYGSSALLMPPDTTGMVLAADLDLQLLKPRWEVAILDLSTQRTAQAIASKLGGVVDTIADRPVVETPTGAYVVEMTPQRFGFTDYPHELPGYPRHLHDAGFETAYIGKWHMGEGNDRQRPGFDLLLDEGIRSELPKY